MKYINLILYIFYIGEKGGEKKWAEILSLDPEVRFRNNDNHGGSDGGRLTYHRGNLYPILCYKS